MSQSLLSEDLGNEASIASRLIVFLYGIASYAVGVAALGWLILIALGVVPFAGLGPELGSSALAVMWNVGMLVLFALQHSVMARPKFKASWVKVVGEPAERATYVLATGLFLIPTLLFWQPMPATVWHLEAPFARQLVYAVALFGWAYLFAASFAINHFELFGIQQVYEHLRGKKVSPVPFKERWMYRFDRHPIMTGVVIGLWATPIMTLGHLVLASGLTLYVWVGVYFEERSLIEAWGDQYVSYAKRVGSIVPSFHSELRK